MSIDQVSFGMQKYVYYIIQIEDKAVKMNWEWWAHKTQQCAVSHDQIIVKTRFTHMPRFSPTTQWNPGHNLGSSPSHFFLHNKIWFSSKVFTLYFPRRSNLTASWQWTKELDFLQTSHLEYENPPRLWWIGSGRVSLYTQSLVVSYRTAWTTIKWSHMQLFRRKSLYLTDCTTLVVLHCQGSIWTHWLILNIMLPVTKNCV